MILLIDNYDSFTWNLYQTIACIEPNVRVVRNDAMTVRELKSLDPSHLVISPGPGTPDQAGVTVDAIRQFGRKIPVLGICLGHQAISRAYGGAVIGTTNRMHGKTSRIIHQSQGLFQGVKTPFLATRYHSLIVDPDQLPEELMVTAVCENGTIMALEHRDMPVYGFQFHPESYASQYGSYLMEQFLRCSG